MAHREHAVAAVAANSGHTAEQALSLIEVDYEILAPVLDGKEAMEPGSPILHDRLFHSEGEFFRPGGLRDDDDDSAPTNIASHFVFELGDPEQGFKDADVVVEREFRTKPVHQGYIEPHSATARWDRDGRVTVWGSSQGHFAIRDFTALVLGIPISQVKVVPMEVGGGFGGKLVVYVEPVAALLSKKSGRPVKITMTRAEVFEGTGATAGGYIWAKIGATDDGHITAADAHFVYESGAFPGALVNLASMTIFAPYNIANVRSEGYDVVVNKPKVSPYRAPLGPPAGFAGETLIDELAAEILNDPTFVEAAQAMGGRLIEEARSDEKRIDRLFLLCLGRRPDEQEQQLTGQLFIEQLAIFNENENLAAAAVGEYHLPGTNLATQAAWVAVSRTIMNLDEFITRE